MGLRPFSSSSTATGDASNNGSDGTDSIDSLSPEERQMLLAALQEAQAQQETAAAAAALTRHPGLPMVCQPAPVRQPVVIGGAVVDLLMRPAQGTPLVLHTSNPGSVRQSFGGVGRNVAEVVAKLSRTDSDDVSASSRQPILFTVAGAEPHGAALLDHCRQEGMAVVNVASQAQSTTAAAASSSSAASDVSGTAKLRTAVYAATLTHEGALLAAVADMGAFDAITPQALGLESSTDSGTAGAGGGGHQQLRSLLSSSGGDASPPPLVLIDGNVPAASTAAIASAAAALAPASASMSGSDRSPILLFEPTSVAKCTRAVDSLHLLTLLKPNRHEVLAMAREWRARMGLSLLEEDAAVQKSASNSSGDGSSSKNRKQQKEKKGQASTSASSTVSQVVTISTGGGEADDSSREEGRLLARETRAVGSEAKPMTVSAYAPPDGEEASADSEVAEAEAQDDDPDSSLDYAVLTAAQTLLAGMVRPCGLATPLSAEGLEVAQRTLQQYSSSGSSEEGDKSSAQEREGTVAQSADGEEEDGSSNSDGSSFASALQKAAAMQQGQQQPPQPPQQRRKGRPERQARKSQPLPTTTALAAASPPSQLPLTTARGPGALIDGRKHVLVSLGKTGVLWVSAPPAPDDVTADLLAALPFFSACQHPALGLDFKLCPAPELPPSSVVKVTGAGDTFTGTLAWALCRGEPLSSAIRLGLAASSIAVTSDVADGASTISARITAAAVRAQARDLVRPVDPEYAA